MTSGREPGDLPVDHPDPDSDEDRPISLAPLFRTLWLYWQVIAIGIAGIGLLTVALLIFATVRTGERVGSVPFRLLFEGAERGTYPNGTPFSPAEIVSAPVLTEVYEKNELRQYAPYETFKRSIYILQANDALEFLTLEYQAKLSEPKLTVPERSRLEDEFRRRRDSIRDPQFSLNLRWRRGLGDMPSPLIGRILTDILDTWAAQAAEKKGALGYNIPTYSRTILSLDSVAADDYLIAVDILRSNVKRVLWSIDQIAALPGAQLIRVGKERTGLADVKANLEDVVQYKLQPLIGFIRVAGLSKDPQAVRLYIENRLFQARQDRQQAASRMQRLQESLRDYVLQRGGATLAERGGAASGGGPGAAVGGAPMVIPQLEGSFLDRLVSLSSQNEDIRYRQGLTDRIVNESLAVSLFEGEVAYYEDLARPGLVSGGPPASRPAAVEATTRRISEAMTRVLAAVDNANTIYDEISKRNLNPATLLFTKTRPFTVTAANRISPQVRSIALLVMILAIFGVPSACLVHHYFLRAIVGRISQPPTTAG